MAINITEAGRLAYQAGLKPKDCPFAIRSSARTWWMKGYKEAKAKAETRDPGFVDLDRMYEDQCSDICGR